MIFIICKLGCNKVLKILVRFSLRVIRYLKIVILNFMIYIIFSVKNINEWKNSDNVLKNYLRFLLKIIE